MSHVVEQLKSRLQAPVAVLYGGDSPEREVSLNSGKAVMAALERSGIDYIGIDATGDWLPQLEQQTISVALIMLHGGAGENGEVQALLAERNIPFTGSGEAAARIAMDKHSSKNVWRRVGVNTANSITVYADDALDNIFEVLGNAVIVKPVHEGSSVGMSIAKDQQTLESAVNDALQYDQSVLIEPLLSGPEYTIAILGDEALPIIQLDPDGVFYDYHAKYVSNNTQYYCPAPVSEALAETMSALAKKAFASLGCRGWGRVDLMMNGDEVFVLEANTVPGMTDHSLVPKAANAKGIDFASLVAQIIVLALDVEVEAN